MLFNLYLLSHYPNRCDARADLQSGRIEYKHLQCDNRIKNPDIQNIGITNPDEHHSTKPIIIMTE